MRKQAGFNVLRYKQEKTTHTARGRYSTIEWNGISEYKRIEINWSKVLELEHAWRTISNVNWIDKQSKLSKYVNGATLATCQSFLLMQSSWLLTMKGNLETEVSEVPPYSSSSLLVALSKSFTFVLFCKLDNKV